MIKNLKPRLYQQTILAACVSNNTLVVLPTGMGKTAIAVLLAGHRLTNFPNSKILLLAPTKPLAQQHLATFLKYFELPEEELVLFTGEVKPEKREQQWKSAKIIFSTPQGLENDLISGKINLEEVSLLIFDEAHRATGDYAYNFIAKKYVEKAKFPRILGLTASPGSDMEKITEVCQNIFIENVEVRTEKDPDVKPYIKEIKIKWIEVELPPELITIKKYLEVCIKQKTEELKRHLSDKVNAAKIMTAGKKELLGIQAELHSKLRTGEKDFETMKAISVLAEIMKAQHALELVETQGIAALQKYFERLWEESKTTKTKALKNLVQDVNFKSAFMACNKSYEEKIEHPKLFELRKIIEQELKKNPETKIIIFTQYRDTAVRIKQEIDIVTNAKTEIFVGQAKKSDTGLSQKKQKEMLDRFSKGEINLLISTSVGEEGLDLPRVDTVIFYEPIPSAIRQIQRRGRTGRLEEGNVIILIAKNTRDVGYKWSAHHKEIRMHKSLDTIKDTLTLTKKSIYQPKLDEFNAAKKNETKIKIFADYREKASNVMKELIDQGTLLNLQQLKTGDYILSERIGVEFKNIPDFVDSIVDGRLLHQIKELKEEFEKPIIILEGTEDIYSQRQVHPNAIRGMIATITIDYGIPIIKTEDYKETAAYLIAIAKREQEEGKKEYSMHAGKPITLKEQQEYLVSALPGVGTSIAKPLLKRFGSVKKIMNAEEKELCEVENLGKIKAKRIRDVMDKNYEN